MLTNSPFYYGTIRKVTEAFAAIFTDIHIVRVNDPVNPTVSKTIQIPLRFVQKEKWYVRNTQNPMPGQDDQVEMVLPVMAFEITGFTYDSSRKLTSTGRTVKAIMNDQTAVKSQFNPVPYNIGYQLNLMVKNVEDGLMVVEQILPFFTPDYTVIVNDIPEISLKKEIPIVLNGVSSEDSWDGDLKERRVITWTMNFTAKAYLYPPVGIKKVILDSTIHLLEEDTATVVESLDATSGAITVT
jgi:hypothetical protein